MEFDGAWHNWVAENICLGGSSASICETLLRAGFDSEQIDTAIRGAETSPYLATAKHFLRQYRKATWVLHNIAKLDAQRVSKQHIERRQLLGSEEFRDRYYFGNRPVIITGRMADWPATQKWADPGYLKSEFGEQLVEVQSNRSQDPWYELNKDAHRTVMRFAELVDVITRNPDSNDIYMTGANGQRNEQFLHAALKDIRFPAEYCSADWRGRAFFWYGAAGTLTPYHHDMTNNFMAQVVGRKHVKLVSPLYLARLYNDQHCFTPIDAEVPDYDRFPGFRGVPVIDVELQPGELLFLPIGWWHFVRAIDVSITVSCTHFVDSNDFLDGYETLWGPI